MERCDPEGMHIACFPLVQFGDNANYKQAKSRNEIMNYPCHVLLVDLGKVTEAVDELIKRNIHD
ncbi:hypothetical protein GLW08_10495 [Pontibacillus yanchengensis]|uniref:Uncharacterized protein n=1 Tax=Pontibacillus yanchengensis TaxID=462910 RepID=A0ACC7VGF5_9BACI|nr:hypothetical protein [Pontibacillus yanchengensis]MYL53765.1 hypothetical protein [Pontibacillus yanchengensis]